MDAVISDIHGNLEALTAVLDEIRRLGATRIICLGDLVCYGPDSLACIRQSASWDVVIAGDWDRAMLEHDPTEWNPAINQHIEWVRHQIRSAPDWEDLLQILSSYQESHFENGRCFAHGTPNDIREWLFPEDIYDSRKLDRISAQFDNLCVCGHSHIPGVFSRDDDDSTWQFVTPVNRQTYDLDPTRKMIVAAGSVGQPRDGDARASFLTLDDDFVRFHRIEYDMHTTLEKIKSIQEIHDMHGQRLLEGR